MQLLGPHMFSPKWIKQLLTGTKEEICSTAITVGNSYTSAPPIDRSSRQKKSTKKGGLKDTCDQMDPTFIFRTLYPNAAEDSFFSGSLGHSLE